MVLKVFGKFSATTKGKKTRAYQNHLNFDKLDNGIEFGYLLAMMPPNLKSISRLFVGFDFFFFLPSLFLLLLRFALKHVSLFLIWICFELFMVIT